MTPEQQQRIREIEAWQQSRQQLVDSAKRVSNLNESHPEIRMHAYIDFLLSLVKGQEAEIKRLKSKPVAEHDYPRSGGGPIYK